MLTLACAASELFRSPELAARGPGLGEPLAGAFGDQVALDLGEQREQRGHDLCLDVALALDADGLLLRHEGDAGLGEGVEDGDDLTQRAVEPEEFAGDQAVATLEGGVSSSSSRRRFSEACPAAGASMKSSSTSCCAVETLR